jgi:glucose-6-phosphate 1-dehydrogenase
MVIRNSAIIILGASGDLAKRKLIPALFILCAQGKMDGSNVIIGSGRTEYTDESFRERFDIEGEFRNKLFYHTGSKGLKTYIESKGRFEQIIVFMALPPSAYTKTARMLKDEGFGEETRIIIEKPFGYDFDSARELNTQLGRYFDESQIYRIDHYLAKEAVQNILVFRFANSIFYPVWNSRYIDSIQINALEDSGVENRASYFDNAGMIRDMMQNHLMQLLCLLTMDAPSTLDAEDVRSQKIDILKVIDMQRCFRYQYEGYREEKGADANSSTETFAEVELRINNFRWTGMPVYIRAGKASTRKGTEIGVVFKEVPRLLFNKEGTIESNRIVFKIQPSEGIIIDLASKQPATDNTVTATHMDFCYNNSFRSQIPEAYQRLLFDALRGDRTLFVGAEETECSWKLFDPFLDKGELRYYTPGTVPESRLDTEWIDFDKYARYCQ